jgi:O-antigen/teichoic acid export membrane protein
METGKIKTSMARDTLLYLPAKAIEGIVGLITITYYTTFFAPNVYGVYNIIITSVNISTLFFLGWLTQSIFRYVNSFKTANKQRLFYSTAFISWLVINSVLLLLGIAAVLVVRNFIDASLANMLIVSIFMFISFNTTQILFSVLGSLRRIKLNLTMSIYSISARLILTCIFVFILKASTQTAIIAILSNLLIDITVVSFIVWRMEIYKKIKIKMFSNKVFSKFLQFGMPLMGVGLTMSLLNLSDRYVIGVAKGVNEVGIYTANYSISSAVFTMILMAVMRGVYPSILKAFKKSDKETTEELISHAVRYFVLIALPAVVGLCILSGQIAHILLDSRYWQGSFVMIWVSVGMFFLGLTEYCNKAWELTSSTKTMFRNSLISASFNIALNIIFVPRFGYQIAAYSTALSYLLYFLLSFIGGRKILTWHIPVKTYARIILSNIVMAAALLLLIKFTVSSGLMLFIDVIAGFAVYFCCLYFSKEIRYEINKLFGAIAGRISSK